MPDRQPLFANPLQQQVFKALKRAGLFNRDSFGWIGSLSDQEALKALNELGVKPELVDVKKEYKNMGGIVSLNQMTQPIGYR